MCLTVSFFNGAFVKQIAPAIQKILQMSLKFPFCIHIFYKNAHNYGVNASDNCHPQTYIFEICHHILDKTSDKFCFPISACVGIIASRYIIVWRHQTISGIYLFSIYKSMSCASFALCVTSASIFVRDFVSVV